MIINFLRIIGITLLIILIILDDIHYSNKFKDPQIQLILTLILIIIIFIDIPLGIISLIILSLIYFKIYSKKIKLYNNQKEYLSNNDNKIIETNDVMKIDYISEAHLLSAQNNIVDINNYNTEIKGMTCGLNNEKVYGVQGLNADNVNIDSYDKNNNLFSVI